jgi:hypothetical protein
MPLAAHFFVALAVAGSSPCAFAAQGDWIWKTIKYDELLGADSKVKPDLGGGVEWINDTCKPDQLGDITSFLSQLGRSLPYNIYIFCRQGHGGVKVRFVPVAYDQDIFDAQNFIDNSMYNRAVSIIGVVAGVRNSLFYFAPQ